MAKPSAGILMFRRRGGELEVLLAHPGGPFWARKDIGAWSIPKGEYSEGEDPLRAARREFQEELGAEFAGAPIALGDVRQKSGKVVSAWGVEGDFDCAGLVSNTFLLEWPPKSGIQQEFPEVDRAEWFDFQTAGEKLLPAQTVFLERLREHLNIEEQPPKPLESPGSAAEQGNLFE